MSHRAPGGTGWLTAARAAVLLLGVSLAGGAWDAAGEDPAAEVTHALRSLGAPGVIWGRLVAEEESPEGPWTPLAGVEVTLYPATPALLAEVERIRQSARASAAQYESAVTRLQAALAAHQARVDAQSAGTPLARLPADPVPEPALPSPARPAAAGKRGAARSGTERGAADATETDGRPAVGKHPFQQATDPGGLFAFAGVPAGDWVVLALRVAPYSGDKLRAEPRPRAASRTQRFTARVTGGTPKEVEIWLGRLRLRSGERASLLLTDRARWFVGPIR